MDEIPGQDGPLAEDGPVRGRPRLAGAWGGLAALVRRVRPDLAPLRHSADFRRLYGGQAASFAGSMITYVAMPYQAYQLTHRSLVVGLLSVAELGPLIAAALLGGLLADRMDRRLMIGVTECCAVAGAAVLALNAMAWHQLWVLFAIAVAGALCFGVQRPSLEALVPQLTPRGDQAAAAALSGLMGNASQVLGPLAGGVLIAAAGLAAGYWADLATSVIALVMFARLGPCPPAPHEERPGLRGIAEGLRYARGRPELMGTYVIDIAAMFFGAPYALFPAFAAKVGGPAALGLLYAAPGAGGLIVSATSGWAGQVRRHGRAIALAAGGWGAAIAAFGLAPGLWWAAAALAAAGGADMVSGIFRMTIWNQTIPARLRGRLAGLEMISYTTGEPLGNLESGLAASLTGSVRLAIVSGGLACVVSAVAVTAALPVLWRYDSRTWQPAGSAPGGGPAVAGGFPEPARPLPQSALPGRDHGGSLPRDALAGERAGWGG